MKQFGSKICYSKTYFESSMIFAVIAQGFQDIPKLNLRSLIIAVQRSIKESTRESRSIIKGLNTDGKIIYVIANNHMQRKRKNHSGIPTKTKLLFSPMDEY